MEIYKDNPSDNVIFFIGNSKIDYIFDKLIELKINKYSFKIDKVKCKIGKFIYDGEDFLLAKFPKINSLQDNLLKKTAIINFLLFYNPILTVITIDYKKINNDLIIVLELLEITDNIILCITNFDGTVNENINIEVLEKMMNIIILVTNKIDNNFINRLIKKIHQNCKENNHVNKIEYDEEFENSIFIVENYIKCIFTDINTRALSIQLLTNSNISKSINKYLNYDINKDYELLDILRNEKNKNHNRFLNIKANKLYIKSIDLN